MSHLGIVNDALSNLDLVYAQSNADKSEVYKLRFAIEKSRYPSMRTTDQVIDEKDKLADHLLLRDRNSKATLACARLYTHAEKRLAIKSRHPEDLLVFGESISNYPLEDYSECDKVYVTQDSTLTPSMLTEIIFTATIAFTRLRFQKFVLSKMSCTQFKQLRSQGILFEQTSYALLTDKGSAYFYASTDDGISESSKNWNSYQHFLGILAHQTNQPHIENHNTQVSTMSKP